MQGHGRRRPTIEDVAHRAKVSIATVSRVVNGSAPVGDVATARVRDAVAELGYRPASAAQVLARRRTGAIGVLLSRISGDYFTPLLRGIESEVATAGMNLLISTGRSEGPLALAEHNTDGLLAFADSLSDSEIIDLWKRDHPLVLLHRTPPPDVRVPAVTVENKAGARQLVDHLVEVHGSRRIAYLRGPAGHEDSRWRELGYLQSLDDHGLAGAAIIGDGGFSAAIAERQVAEWLASGTRLDAVFAGDDAAAVGALRAVQAFAADRPIGVVGFDDVPLARHIAPPLTTVRAPTEEVGRIAVRRLLEAARGTESTDQVLLPTEVVIRQSCGCPAVPDDGPPA
ncbi:MAG TPA: LacI family DNA-binding transcriptional regulator [Candidatus Limnocylindrales bacterium]|nr:LacI family DNA-binding transcriptional regulator [Candidatus Limnocylindrales bacterium]